MGPASFPGRPGPEPMGAASRPGLCWYLDLGMPGRGAQLCTCRYPPEGGCPPAPWPPPGSCGPSWAGLVEWSGLSALALGAPGQQTLCDLPLLQVCSPRDVAAPDLSPWGHMLCSHSCPGWTSLCRTNAHPLPDRSSITGSPCTLQNGLAVPRCLHLLPSLLCLWLLCVGVCTRIGMCTHMHTSVSICSFVAQDIY